jgi:cadherin EGF LAG seven-pass G-type receptor 1
MSNQFIVIAGMFSIDSGTGVVTTLTSLDRELVELHYFRVTAVDDSFPPRSGTTTLQINVLDANDHAPIFEASEYDASIRESVSVGSTVVTLKATDQDVGRNAEVARHSNSYISVLTMLFYISFMLTSSLPS